MLKGYFVNVIFNPTLLQKFREMPISEIFCKSSQSVVWEGTVSLGWEVTVRSVCLSVGQSVGRSVSQSVSHNQSVRKGKRVYSGRCVMRKIKGRRKEPEGFINTGKCQGTRRRPIYTTTVELIYTLANQQLLVPKADKIYLQSFLIIQG